MSKLPRNQEFFSDEQDMPNPPKAELNTSQWTETTSEGGTFNVWVDDPQPRNRWWRRVRSSVTGRFAKREEAKLNPDTTVEEKVARKGGK